jgi:sugar lactone lactonase YvrE
LSDVETAFLLTPPTPPVGYTCRGGIVGVQTDARPGTAGKIWVDNLKLEPSGPAPGFGWWQAFDSLLPWNLESGKGYRQVWTAYQDSAGVENALPLVDTIILDAQAPVAAIVEPEPGTTVNDTVELVGLAYDSTVIPGHDFFEVYRLQHRHADSTEWQPNEPDSVCYAPVTLTPNPGLHSLRLGNWNTTGLPDAQYWLRVVVRDSAGNESVDSTWVEVDNSTLPGGQGAGPGGGGSGLGQGSIFVGSATGRVLHSSESFDSLGAFTVSDSAGPAYVAGILSISADSILVLDSRNRAIHKLARNGRNRRQFVGNLGLPSGIARDENGNIWLCDKGTGRVAKFRPNGTPVFARTRGEGDTLDLSQPEAIAIAGNRQVGNSQWVYIADTRNNRIAVWDTAGTYLRSISVARPQAIAVVQSPCGGSPPAPGAIYVVDSAGRIKGLNSGGGRFLTITSPDSTPFKCLLLSENEHHLFTLKPTGNLVLKYRIRSDDSMPGGAQAAGTERLPTSFILYQPCPNPSRTALHIRYGIPRATRVTIKLYDIAGKLCRTLVNEQQRPRYYSLTWNRTDNAGRTVANGIYFCQMVTDAYRSEKKVVLAR